MDSGYLLLKEFGIFEIFNQFNLWLTIAPLSWSLVKNLCRKHLQVLVIMSEDNEGPIIKYVFITLLGRECGLVGSTLAEEMWLLISGSSSSEEEA